MPPSNPAQENWTGHILTSDEGRQISGIQAVWDARLLNPFLTTLMPQAKEMLAAAAGRRRGGAAEARRRRPSCRVDVKAEFAKTIDAIARTTRSFT